MDNKSLYRSLQEIALLGKENGYTAKQLANLFNVTIKTIYRDFEIFRDCGFKLEKDKDNRYRIVKYNTSVFSDSALSFSLEEASLIKDALLATHSNHPLKNEVLDKLFALSELDNIVEFIYDQKTGGNLRKLKQAIKGKKQVRLSEYHSSSSNTTKDRIVEPISFHQNLKYLFAFEISSKKVKQFKPERAGDVEILGSNFKYEELHRPQVPDLFGMNSEPVENIDLKLNTRANNLLREEFPGAEKHLEELKDGMFLFSVPVKGYEGIGRFVLGLPGDVKVLGTVGFKEYLEGKANKYLKPHEKTAHAGF